MEDIKGCIVFYVPVKHGSIMDYDKIIALAKENHITTITAMKEKGWESLFVPCVGEASHAGTVTLDNGSGCVIVYININAEDSLQGVNIADLITYSQEDHSDLIKRLNKKGWELMFMPCVGEGGRVEKINFEETDVN